MSSITPKREISLEKLELPLTIQNIAVLYHHLDEEGRKAINLALDEIDDRQSWKTAMQTIKKQFIDDFQNNGLGLRKFSLAIMVLALDSKLQKELLQDKKTIPKLKQYLSFLDDPKNKMLGNHDEMLFLAALGKDEDLGQKYIKIFNMKAKEAQTIKAEESKDFVDEEPTPTDTSHKGKPQL